MSVSHHRGFIFFIFSAADVVAVDRNAAEILSQK